MKRPPVITVVGSVNMDLVLRCARLPDPGQTVHAESVHEYCGGKGANQAVAAARAGGEVRMIGRVGSDAFATRLLEGLEGCGVNCAQVRRTADCRSGLAVIGVEQSGQNSIMVVPGANGRLTPQDVEDAAAVIRDSDILLVQLEVPQETVAAAVKTAAAAGVRVLLDPAPAPQQLLPELIAADVICPNETEAAALTGIEVTDGASAATAARSLLRKGARHVIVTMGSQGAWLQTGDDDNSSQFAAPTVEAVDTTAAGDAFAGAFAVRWAETGDIREAIPFACAAGSLAASRMGAQESMGTRAQIETVLNGAISRSAGLPGDADRNGETQ